MLGFIIGAISGVIQFLLLSKFIDEITRGKMTNKAVIFAVSQFLLPLIVLISCALLLSQSLLLTGISMAATLIILAIIKLFLSVRK